MDVRTLAKVLKEVNRLLPDEAKEKIVKTLDAATDKLWEVGQVVDEATRLAQDEEGPGVWDLSSDKVVTPNEVRDQKQPTFEDIIKEWDTAEPQATPGAESAGREDEVPTIDSITRTLYRFMANNDQDYAMPSEKYEEWNVRHPVFIAVDYLKFVAEVELNQMDEDS